MSQPKKAPLILRIFVLLVILTIFLGVGGGFYWNYIKSPVDPNGTEQAFVVQKGESAGEVAQSLEDKKIIRSAFAFKTLLKLNGNSAHVEAGDFKVSPSMTTEEVIVALGKGAVDKWVTLLEGWRLEQVADEINQELGISQADFLKAAKGKEGYLFPDTYLFNKDATAETIVSTMENTFDKKYDSALQAKIKANGLTPEQGVILASIVEREGRSAEVKKNVASILLKRLNNGIALNADATVQYAKDSQTLAKGTKLSKFWLPITLEEYHSIVSPYNTYLHAGLPPGPISNPGLTSLQAVANADSETPYLYYYVDSQGNIYYAKTLDEHEANVQKHP